jgi:hypothetical protein
VKKISMTLSSADVTLTDGRGSLTASVTNGSETPERVVLGAFASGAPLAAGAPPAGPETGADAGPLVAATGDPAAAKPTWTTVDRPLRTIGAGATEQYAVSFDTQGAEPGTYPVKLIPYSADEAPDDYADLGVVVRLAVPPGRVGAPKAKRTFPWWIVIVAGAVLVIAAAVALFLATRGPGTEPEPLAQPEPLGIDRDDVRVGDTIRIGWQPYTCPAGSDLSGYDVRVEPDGAAFLVGQNPDAEATTAILAVSVAGDFEVSYRAVCGEEVSEFSSPITVSVREFFD